MAHHLIVLIAFAEDPDLYQDPSERVYKGL